MGGVKDNGRQCQNFDDISCLTFWVPGTRTEPTYRYARSKKSTRRSHNQTLKKNEAGDEWLILSILILSALTHLCVLRDKGTTSIILGNRPSDYTAVGIRWTFMWAAARLAR